MTDTNRFADALEAHDPTTLRAAFDACQQRSEEGYDRTTLNQWLKGSIPRKGEFVHCLADELDDPDLLDAWYGARDRRGPSPIRNVVGRFENLSPEEQDEAFHNIRRVYVSNFEQEMSRIAYRVEIDDPADPGDSDHLVARVIVSFEGRVPDNVRVDFATNPKELGNAYGDPSCLFREILAFDRPRLEELLDNGPDQVLTYTPLTDDNPIPVSHIGERNGLSFSFENEGAERAAVTLDLEYPFPRGRPVFFIRFGRYYVPDYAEVTLALSSQSTSEPQAFPFLPPGRQRAFTSIPIRGNELRVSLGTDNTVLSEGDGVVLYWTETAL